MRSLLVALVLVPALARADGAETTRVELADAFGNKDLVAIEKRVSDPYSGLRFSSGWDAAEWKAVAKSLRSAKTVEATASHHLYRVVLHDRERTVPIDLMNDAWRLDLNALLGPFPHM